MAGQQLILRGFPASVFSAVLALAAAAMANAALLRGLQQNGVGDILNNNTQVFVEDEEPGICSFPGEAYQYAIIPLISAIVGYGTNWIALKMTFYPTEFYPARMELVRCGDQPIGICGWQGIIPTKAAKMAAMSCDIMMDKLFNIKELFERIDESKAAQHIKPGFGAALARIIDEISHEYIIDSNTTWKATEGAIKKQVNQWAMAELPAFTEGFMKDLVKNLDDCYDLKHMVVSECTEHKEILNDLFISVGAKELRFIERSGFYFGFLFGLVQTLVYGCYQGSWVLPVFGFIVGFATNFIALKMIFQPIEPITVFGGRYKVHGVFLKRQQEASAVFATKMVETVLHSKNIWHYMLTGPKHDGFEKILRVHADAFTDRMVGYMRPLVQMWIGAKEFEAIKRKIQDTTISEIGDIVRFMHEYTDEALDLEHEIRVKMQALPSKEFERVLHPVFEEDELKLIIVGAVLGAAVGAIQTILFA